MNRFMLSQIRLAIPLVLIFVILTGCATPTAAPVPTIDQEMIIAAAVETLGARMTVEAELNPTATLLPTATPLPPSPTQLPPTEIPSATALQETATPVFALSARLAYVTSWPENKRIYIPNEIYGLAIGFENTGTVTWAAGSILKLVDYKGEPTVQTEVTLEKAVLPGEKVEYALWTFGSETLGEHTFYFQLFTKEGLAIPGGFASYTYTAV